LDPEFHPRPVRVIPSGDGEAHVQRRQHFVEGLTFGLVVDGAIYLE
jgi:hypothetical protein